MHLGVFLHCEQRSDATLEEAFDEAFALADLTEREGLDGVWLAELHFASLDGGSTGRTPSIAAAPLILATALAARTKRVRIGIAVSLLPLVHPVRLAEEVATLDHVSRGRLDLGVGRSGFQIAYAGYGVPYAESRERFDECLEVLTRAWTQEKVSFAGKYTKFDEVSVVPKPYQKPHPPVRVAASTHETFPKAGRNGSKLFVRMGSSPVTEVAEQLEEYRHAWKQAGHPGDGDAILSLPVYPELTPEQLERVAGSIREFYGRPTRVVRGARPGRRAGSGTSPTSLAACAATLRRQKPG
jgi:alkanesulfonate monooxygenase SsuD/methylene tetrahydromethanopterin reductase-like flavin-dependent oxidoreductase (luciferase family)